MLNVIIFCLCCEMWLTISNVESVTHMELTTISPLSTFSLFPDARPRHTRGDYNREVKERS